MSSAAKSVCFFALCFAFGLSAFFGAYENSNPLRDPAALSGKIFQITSLSSEQIKNHISHKIKVFPTTEGKKSIQLSGFSSALCKIYPEIEMEFQAEGVAVAGEIPSMKITSPCEVGQDPAEMASFQLPVSKILSEKPKNAEFSFNGFAAKIEFRNSADTWPKIWILKSVHFRDTAGKRKTATFDRYIASEAKETRPIVLEF